MQSLALLTDLYQLTMAFGYFQLGMHEQEAVFHLIFRNNPFKGNYAICCGLGSVIEMLESWHFAADDLDYLGSLKTPIGTPLFSQEFLDYLQELRFSCDVDAIPEGHVVFPQEPLLRIKGPLLQGQLLESILLNIINFQTLIATKASRVCRAARGDEVLEFGLRRAQGPDGGLSASRAAYIGGCSATSNTLAGKKYDIPVRGTHAHSWVTAFPDELSAFYAYAEVMPHNCVLLVDTYDSLLGVQHAIEVGKKLRERGAVLRGVRLDSGNLAKLSTQARQLLDEAGFPEVKIVASNSLDEYVIEDLKNQRAEITTWGVGTHLVTAYDYPALDGVYKLSALKDSLGQWQYKLKLSEQKIKTSNPGIHQVRRFWQDQKLVGDMIYDTVLGVPALPMMMRFTENAGKNHMQTMEHDNYVDLLQPIFRAGKKIVAHESLHDLRLRAITETQQFFYAYGNQEYPVGIEQNLAQLKQHFVARLSTSEKNIG